MQLNGGRTSSFFSNHFCYIELIEQIIEVEMNLCEEEVDVMNETKRVSKRVRRRRRSIKKYKIYNKPS